MALQIPERSGLFPSRKSGNNLLLGGFRSPTATSPQDLSWHLPEEVAAHNVTRSKAHHLLLKLGHYETLLALERESSRALTLSLQSMQRQVVSANEKRTHAEEALRNCPGCQQMNNIGIAIETDVSQRTPFFDMGVNSDEGLLIEQNRQPSKRKRADEDHMPIKRMKSGPENE
ncbi:hypothetical protein VE01_09450 [Pseudogymnoascus verrucosus]|uniref:Uncharacterized protein n=1 Tax=Pseudogymnoascus verrucosus TaxID=342668 RepID=A0A1B8G9L4_9PEZI|nr:uncharacterized protein VE01_09450 [Pseudogymnoascus verrucosus]OBT92523.1 hypothetical protein VE01_09450 [Pseudogymnoascus verrucosus]